MCGIFGGLALTQPFRAETARALSQLAHRGPDGEGIAALDHAVLGHRRLSIIDLSHAADQPLWDARHQVVIVFNGEIYNYRELRRECVAAGLELTSASDTEVIVNQYLLHGEKAFDRLNGMFAFCLYDTRSGTGYLVRDPFGIKPLYYAAAPVGVVFSSELQTILDSGCVDFEIDRAALQAYLQLDFVPTPLTMVRGVRKLEGGWFAKVSASGQIEQQRYFRRLVGRISPSEEALLEFGRLIDAAVERHLISDVPIGVFLSGGIDSTIIAESARRVSADPVSTFSIAFDDASFDESRWFAAVARLLQLNQHTRELTSDAMVDLVPEIGERLGEPLADGSIYPTYLLSRFAREHVTVVLSGDGADELFSGYPTYLAHSVARRLPGLALRGLRNTVGAAHRLLPVRYENFSPEFKVKKFLGGLHPDLIKRHFRWMGTFEEEQLPDLLTHYDADAERAVDSLLLQPSIEADDGWLEQLLRTDQRFYLSDGVLVKVDRASMATSLEVRVPFLDCEVVAFADSLPPHAKLRGRTSKWFLREYVGRRLPREIASRPKKGFGAPIGKWFRGPLRPMLEKVLARNRVAAGGVLRPEFVHRLLEDHWSGRRDNRKQILNLLVFTLWCERFGRRVS